MRDSSMEITRLCESWWERLTDSSRSEQRRFAEELLALLDWEQPVPFTPKEGATALSAAPYLLRAGGQTAVVAYFVMPGTLEPPSAMTERGLDFCPATRVLVREARAISVNYVFVSDLYRSYLYDARTEELLLGADDPRMFNELFVPALSRTPLERGALEELRRQPRSVVARRLREWMQQWVDTLSRRSRLAEDQALLVVDRLLVIRYLFDHDILRRTKWRLQQRFAQLVKQASEKHADKCGEELAALFHDMWFDWRIDLFEPHPGIDEALSESGVVASLLKEFHLLSRSKFSIATILESFNYGDPAEKMRVRMVPDVNEEREHYLHKQTLDTIDTARIDIDLVEEGYRAIFHWFDKVVALYDRLEGEFQVSAYRSVPQAQELDLFGWSELDANRPSACADRFAHACEHGFGIYYNSARQYRIARLLLTLHLISRYDQTRQAVDRLPSMKKVLMKRPVVLPAERVMNIRASMDEPLENYDRH